MGIRVGRRARERGSVRARPAFRGSLPVVASLSLLLAACSGGPIDVRDAEELARVLREGAALELLAGDLGFVEGPVWTDEDGGYLVFSDIRGGRLLSWTAAGGVQLYRSPVPGPNGNTRDAEGRLLTCEQAGRRVTRTERDGSLTVLADRFRGRHLNSPNDVVVAADGAVWFTDPALGIPRGQRQELEGAYLFRLAPSAAEAAAGVPERSGGAEPSVEVTDFDAPNGLAFSPDGRVLYVTDIGEPGHVRAFDVGPDGALSGDRVLYVSATGHPDGLRCDADGRLWIATADGIHVVLPSGRLIGRIRTPEPARNVCFGGEGGRTLFVTAGSSLYALRVAVSGS